MNICNHSMVQRPIKTHNKKNRIKLKHEDNPINCSNNCLFMIWSNRQLSRIKATTLMPNLDNRLLTNHSKCTIMSTSYRCVKMKTNLKLKVSQTSSNEHKKENLQAVVHLRLKKLKFSRLLIQEIRNMNRVLRVKEKVLFKKLRKALTRASTNRNTRFTKRKVMLKLN